MILIGLSSFTLIFFRLITDILPSEGWVTYNIFLSGSTSISAGSLPIGISLSFWFVFPFRIVSVSLSRFDK